MIRNVSWFDRLVFVPFQLAVGGGSYGQRWHNGASPIQFKAFRCSIRALGFFQSLHSGVCAAVARAPCLGGDLCPVPKQPMPKDLGIFLALRSAQTRSSRHWRKERGVTADSGLRSTAATSTLLVDLRFAEGMGEGLTGVLAW